MSSFWAVEDHGVVASSLFDVSKDFDNGRFLIRFESHPHALERSFLDVLGTLPKIWKRLNVNDQSSATTRIVAVLVPLAPLTD